MSMLSAQRDRLHLQVELLESHGRFVGFGGAVSIDPLMVGAAREMRHAADTTWSLRNKLNNAIDERDEAREERDSYRASLQEAEHEESLAWDRVRKAETENAKLRELICNYSEATKYLCKTFGSCRKCNLDCASWFGSDKKQNEMDCARTLLDMEARELGVEVD